MKKIKIDPLDFLYVIYVIKRMIFYRPLLISFMVPTLFHVLFYVVFFNGKPAIVPFYIRFGNVNFLCKAYARVFDAQRKVVC